MHVKWSEPDSMFTTQCFQATTLHRCKAAVRALQDAMIREFQAEIARLRAQLASAGAAPGPSPTHAVGYGAPGTAAAADMVANAESYLESAKQSLAFEERGSLQHSAQARASALKLVRCQWARMLKKHAFPGIHYELIHEQVIHAVHSALSDCSQTTVVSQVAIMWRQPMRQQPRQRQPVQPRRQPSWQGCRRRRAPSAPRSAQQPNCATLESPAWLSMTWRWSIYVHKACEANAATCIIPCGGSCV